MSSTVCITGARKSTSVDNNGDRAGEHPEGCSGKPRELRRVSKVLTMTEATEINTQYRW